VHLTIIMVRDNKAKRTRLQQTPGVPFAELSSRAHFPDYFFELYRGVRTATLVFVCILFYKD